MSCVNNCVGDCGCHNELNLERACIHCLKADCAKVCQVIANDVCSQMGEFKQLSVESEVANNLCVASKLQAKEAWVDKAYNNSLCVSGSASINNLCVNNLQVANDFEVCNVYRAAATSSSSFSYNLGSNVDWNVVLDDPNGNVSLSPFRYTIDADQAGYYAFNFHLDVSNLQSSTTISGSPIGVQELLVNGVKFVDKFTPFLAFSTGQSSQFSGVILLKGGDVVTMDYKVLVMDPVNGLQPLVGTVDVSANGQMAGQSFFDIIKLAGMCNSSQPVVCAPCPVVEVPCQPVSVPCSPLSHCPMPGESNPCDTCC